MATIAILIVCFTACKPVNGEEVDPASTSGSGDLTNVDETTASFEMQTTKEPESATEAATTGTVSLETTQSTTAAPTLPVQPKKPEAIPEIVAYYNTAANKVKTEKPGYRCLEATLIRDVSCSNRLLNRLAPTIIGMFLSEELQEEAVVTKGASHSNFPVEKQNWSSRLEPQAVQSATCIEKGETYEIEIWMKPEALPEPPKDRTTTRHGKLMNVLEYHEIFDEIEKFSFLLKIESFQPTYRGSYVKCTVDKASGMPITATYYFSTDVVVVAKVAGLNIDASANFVLIQEFHIN